MVSFHIVTYLKICVLVDKKKSEIFYCL